MTATSTRIVALALWFLALACFGLDWYSDTHRLGAVGCAALVFYGVMVAKHRRQTGTSPSEPRV